MKIDLGLRGKMALALGLVVGGSLALSAIAEYWLVRSAMLDRLEGRELPLVLDSVASRVGHSVSQSIEIARSISENAYVGDYVDSGEPESERASLVRYLEHVKHYSGALSTFVVVRSTGHYYTDEGLVRTVDPNRQRDRWFFDFLAARKSRELQFDVDESNGRATVFVNQAFGGERGTAAGVAGVGLELRDLVQIVSRARVGRSMQVYLVDRRGTVEVHSDLRRVHADLGADPRFEQLVLGGSGRIHAYERDGERLFVGSRLVPDADWFVVAEMSQDAMLAPLRRTLMMTLGLAVVLGILSVLAGLVVGNVLAGHLLGRAEQAELIDHMGQALVVFGPDGRVTGEASRRADELFGKGAGRAGSISELLYPDSLPYDLEAAAFRELLPLAFGTDAARWDTVAELAPRELVLRRGRPDEAHLELEFRPIVEDGHTIRIMLLATDVTAERRLEAARLAAKSQHERELASMRLLVGGGADNFLSFLRQSESRLEALEAGFVGADPSLDSSEIEFLFRHAHTVTGEARSFGQEHLENAMRAIEDRLAELRGVAAKEGRAAVDVERGLALAEIGLAKAELERARETFVEASPLGPAALDRVSVRRSDLDRVARLVETCEWRLGVDAPVLRDVVSRLNARPFGEVAQIFVDAVPRWGEQAGKRVVFEVIGKDAPIPAEFAPVLRGALMHLVRNSIAHGIERPSDRTRQGKERVGRIKAAARIDEGRFEIVVEDDGAGVDVDALTRRAMALGVGADVSNPCDLLFVSGISTTESADDLSGRGVGMAAVRDELRDVGYTVRVESWRDVGTKFIVTKAEATGSVRPGSGQLAAE